MIALQRTGDPGKLSALRDHLDLLSGLDPNPETTSSDWKLLNEALEASEKVVLGLLAFMSQHSTRRQTNNGNGNNGNPAVHGPSSFEFGAFFVFWAHRTNFNN